MITISAFAEDVSALSPEELKVKVRIAVEEEMCMTVEDFLSRRTRLLLLDTVEAIKLAPVIAGLMGSLLNKDEEWSRQQVLDFNLLAKNYLPTIN